MIKIQLSYRIIKKGNVSDLEKTIPLTETKFNFIEKDDLKDEIIQESKEPEIDLEAIREKIRESIYLEIEEEKNKILNDAKIEGDKIKLGSRKQGYQVGHKEGYRAGYEEAINKAKDEAELIKANALNLIKQSKNHVVEYIEENQEKLIKLAVHMAESIVHHTIDESSDNILMLVKPILQKHEKRDNIIISCHPSNYLYVKEHLEELRDISPETRFIILKDGNLERNGCIIENEHQVIDLQIKNQIESILEEIENLE